MVNDGIAGVPGVLRISVCHDDGSVIAGGCLDPGYPRTRGVQQALIMLPKGADWKGLKIKAELEEAQQAYADAWSNKDFDAISEMWSHDDDITIWGPGLY